MAKIYEAIPAIMAEIGVIAKDRTNEAQRYKFRGIDDVYNELHPLLVKHKVFTVPEIMEEKDEQVVTAKGSTLFYRLLKIKYTFYADDGSSVIAVVRGEGMDSGDKASNKAMAVAHKYALMQIFAIPTDEPKDPENESHEVVVKPHDNREALRARYSAVLKSGYFEAERDAMNEEMKSNAQNLPSVAFLVAKYEKELEKRKAKDTAGAAKAFDDVPDGTF